MKIAFITHEDCISHKMDEDHLERPDRVRVIMEGVKESALKKDLDFFYAPLATKAQLYSVHDKDYVDNLFNQSPKRGLVKIDDDTALNPHTIKAARRAAGAAIKAVDFVMNGKYKRVFCNVRPPGHHAERKKAMGFCFFNNVAIAAQYAMRAYGAKKVAIVDFDAHHGNGTEDIFQENEQVLFLSCFQKQLFPFWEGEDTDHILHAPLKVRTKGESLTKLFDDQWLPKLEAFKPDMIFISAGFDAHEDDPYSNLKFQPEDYEWMTQKLVQKAETLCSGRIISVLEGGYDLEALRACALSHLKALTSYASLKQNEPYPVIFRKPVYNLRKSSKSDEKQSRKRLKP